MFLAVAGVMLSSSFDTLWIHYTALTLAHVDTDQTPAQGTGRTRTWHQERSS